MIDLKSYTNLVSGLSKQLAASIEDEDSRKIASNIVYLAYMEAIVTGEFLDTANINNHADGLLLKLIEVANKTEEQLIMFIQNETDGLQESLDDSIDRLMMYFTQSFPEKEILSFVEHLLRAHNVIGCLAIYLHDVAFTDKTTPYSFYVLLKNVFANELREIAYDMHEIWDISPYQGDD